ncbi:MULTISPECIES: UDP-N-acetylglucosamine 2-epimerase (non-hydrolyzing) [Cryobacterium]|uniref:UDP-N-acetylglucosamine 2-epimerase (Non-hydrolyzing) n=1 Tax=Cryobacterium breve TaxID=1259258 RepID=A0ABY2J2E5_9MICO|nr:MULTISPECIES: UDP-N-acetylglucosamine 2-epimerase (non-hydrolyzing) [Cryobacterium]TFC93276.1 UDP-N-acetylglucosamine 2-epimerase (non-hydrolyzing) [Cryobacterium sp. TmT3-12]TFC97868.1 UDP-N-acetylglucosamine 2-epimerase (non-hydrolyzing) [Cryobacterium breve]
MAKRLKVMTVVGTRPEIIRLAPTIKRLDQFTDHVLVHTGQNYDYELNEVFFEDLGLRKPDYFLEADTTSLGRVLGSILVETERILNVESPDAFLVLGDTNSCISAVIAKRMKVPVYHMEAGNRCFDENVPEETNRRLVDHVADYNLVYTEHARRNLLGEGIHPSRIILTGSPMREVLDANAEMIASSNILEREGLTAGEYFLVSLHREENVDNSERLATVLSALTELAETYGLPVLVSTHPRTLSRLGQQPDELKTHLSFHAPFGFNDYVRLQKDAKLVLSDSGTISEESSLLGFPAVTLRDSIERPEAIDMGAVITAGVESDAILDAVALTMESFRTDGRPGIPEQYIIADTSRRVVNFIRSTAHSHRARSGIRGGFSR